MLTLQRSEERERFEALSAEELFNGTAVELGLAEELPQWRRIATSNSVDFFLSIIEAVAKADMVPFLESVVAILRKIHDTLKTSLQNRERLVLLASRTALLLKAILSLKEIEEVVLKEYFHGYKERLSRLLEAILEACTKKKNSNIFKRLSNSLLEPQKMSESIATHERTLGGLLADFSNNRAEILNAAGHSKTQEALQKAESEVKKAQSEAAGAWEEVKRARKDVRRISESMKRLSRCSSSFIEEVDLWTVVSTHPRILPVYGAALQPWPFVISPLLRHGTVVDYLQKKRAIPMRDLLQLISDVADGMKWLHALGYIHRDLKGNNVLVDENGRAVLMDFGLSQKVENTSREPSASHRGVGTLRWMAPELFSNGIGSKEADVFAFAVTCYEIWSFGDIPLADMDEDDVPEKVKSGARPNLDHFWNIPVELKVLITQCWDANPGRRPSFENIVRALEKIIESVEVEALQPIFDIETKNPLKKQIDNEQEENIVRNPTMENFLKSLKDGVTRSFESLVMYFKEGRLSSEDFKSVVPYCIEYANQGSAEAMNAVGDIRYFGFAVPQDYTEAFRWYQRAALEGHKIAQLNLVMCYRRGHGIEQNIEKAQEVRNAVRTIGVEGWIMSIIRPLVLLSHCYTYSDIPRRLRRLLENLNQWQRDRILKDVLNGDSEVTLTGGNGSSIGEAGARVLAEALKANSTLTSLTIYYNSIGDAGGSALAEALKTNSTLTSLNLYYNSIGDAGGSALAEALKTNSTLTALDVTRNSIGEAGATALAEALKTNSTLMSLNLYWNSIGDAGARALAEALKTNSTLTLLNLYGNSIGDAGGNAVGEALKTNSTLTSLDVSGNSIDDAGATALAGALMTNSILTSLNLYDNSIGETGATALAQALKTNSTLTSLDLT
ncbi:hypothetical protein HDU93_007648, partial [Gonapodya sp. JEL0774]